MLLWLANEKMYAKEQEKLVCSLMGTTKRPMLAKGVLGSLCMTEPDMSVVIRRFPFGSKARLSGLANPFSVPPAKKVSDSNSNDNGSLFFSEILYNEPK